MTLIMRAFHRRQREVDALVRAERYVRVNRYYQDKTLTDRERALMRLALRAYTSPELTEAEIERLGGKELGFEEDRGTPPVIDVDDAIARGEDEG